MEHGSANDSDWRESLAHEVVVKLLEIESCALFFHHVGTKLHYFKLPQGVIEVGCIGGAALGFNQCDRARLISVGDEEINRLVERELAGVKLDGVDEAGVAEQGVLKLTEAN